jgi:DNA polymerase-3 subunit delta'
MSQSQHPDFRWIRPDAEAAEEGAVEAAEEGGTVSDSQTAEPKKKSQEIRIEQIRGLAGFANIGSHRGGLRVVVISPANRMNYAAANALLKTLEEPAPSLAFILVADQLHSLPATIVSRCRRINLAIPDGQLAKRHTEQSQAAPWLLPLLLEEEVDPIRWAEKAAKAPPTDALDLLMRWMADAARVRLGLLPRAFPDQAAALRRQALRIRSDQSWAQTMAELQRLRIVSEHPLNPKLFYESIFDRLRRVLI